MRTTEISSTLLQHINNMVVYTDAEGIIRYVNPEFEKITHYKKSEVEGNTPRILKSGKQQGRFYTKLWKDMKAGKVCEATFINQKKNGDYYYQETKIIPVEKSKKINGYLSIGTDITDSVRKVIFIDNLTKEVNALNKDFGTFLYKTTHDLRGPVLNIMGVLELVKLDIDNPKLLDYFNLISRSTDKLDRILVDLVRISIIRTSALVANPIDFNTLLDEILRNLNKFYPIKKFTVTRSVTLKQAYRYEKIVLRNILRALLENAFQYRKYVPMQEVPTDDAWLNKHEVDVAIFEENNHLIMRVKDNGIGIEKKLQNKIFDMFYKASERSNGTGLGLFILKSALQRLNGEIDMESRVGKGTSVTIRIPAMA
jgi:PAS domain S-box-containing protein